MTRTATGSWKRCLGGRGDGMENINELIKDKRFMFGLKGNKIKIFLAILSGRKTKREIQAAIYEGTKQMIPDQVFFTETSYQIKDTERETLETMKLVKVTRNEGKESEYVPNYEGIKKWLSNLDDELIELNRICEKVKP